MRELAFRMSLHAASPGAALDRTHILYRNYAWLNESSGQLEGLETNANALARFHAAPSWTQRVPFCVNQTQIVYRTDWGVAWAAAVVGIAGVLAVLPLYIGWWELGRTPSLNRLKTGVAMEASLLLQRGTPDESLPGGGDAGSFGGGGSGGGGGHQ